MCMPFWTLYVYQRCKFTVIGGGEGLEREIISLLMHNVISLTPYSITLPLLRFF